jgi:hypothetical protein
MTFAQFDEQFIVKGGLFLAVHSKLATNCNGDRVKIFEIDLICEWHGTDKLRYFAVEFDTEKQYDRIVVYLKLCADLLRDSVLSSIDTLDEFEAAGPRTETHACLVCAGRGLVWERMVISGVESNASYCPNCSGAGKTTHPV